MKEQEESSIKVRNTTKDTILMNFMNVILNRGLDSNNQLLSDEFVSLVMITLKSKKHLDTKLILPSRDIIWLLKKKW